MIFLLGVLLSALAIPSNAVMITQGTFSIAGTIYVTGPGGVTIPGVGSCPVTFQCIFWQDTGTPAQNGLIDISPLGLPDGNIPLNMSGNDAGVISNLTNPPEIVDGTGFAPMTFMSFLNGGVTTVLDINMIPAGINGSAGCSASPPDAKQLCTPPGSLFNLQNLSATSSTATWRFMGITDDKLANWTGTFSSQFNNIPFQTVLAALSTNGFASNTFAGQITLTPVPEPGTLPFLFLGSGMVIGSTLLRRLSRR
jgi:hypothetical protein